MVLGIDDSLFEHKFKGLNESGKQQYLRDIKYGKALGKLDGMEWFWFHPTSFMLIYYSIPGCLMATMSALSIILYYQGNYFIGSLFLLLFFVGAYQLHKNIKNHQYLKNTTFYEVFVKQKPLKEV